MQALHRTCWLSWSRPGIFKPSLQQKAWCSSSAFDSRVKFQSTVCCNLHGPLSKCSNRVFCTSWTYKKSSSDDQNIFKWSNHSQEPRSWKLTTKITAYLGMFLLNCVILRLTTTVRESCYKQSSSPEYRNVACSVCCDLVHNNIHVFFQGKNAICFIKESLYF